MKHRFPVESTAGRAGALRQRGYPVINTDLTKIGGGPGLGAPLISPYLKVKQVEIAQVGGRFHQERRVGVVAVVFKGRETTIDPEITAVENQIAFNPVNTHAA